MKKLIINADDYGLTNGVSRAILDLLQQNAISNTTVMVCIDGVEADCELLKEAKLSHRAGLHFQSTLENHHKKALSDPKKIPSLVDETGCFKETGDAIKQMFNAEDIRKEWELQVEKFMDIFGHKPSHLDSHHGVHRVSHIKPVYYELAKKLGVPVRGGKAIGQIDGSAYGVISSAWCEGTWTGQEEPLSVLQEKILAGFNLVNNGVVELVCHPGFCDDELVAASSWNTVRENDYKILLQMARENWLSGVGIDLIKYPHLEF